MIKTDWKDKWLFAEVDSKIYAYLRIAFAAAVAQWFWSLKAGASWIFSDQGYTTIEEIARYTPSELSRFSLLHYFSQAQDVHLLLDIGLLTAACYALGLATPITSVALWLLVMSFRNRFPNWLTDGGSSALNQLAFLLLWAPTWKCLSLDSLLLKRLGVAYSRRSWNWILTLLQFQLCVAYSTTGFYKLMGAAWVNGTALEQVLANANYSKLATTGEFILPLWSIPFLRISTWLVLFWELLFPLLIWKRRIRYLALFFGVLVHLGIWLMLDVGSFSPAMLVSYLSFLYPENEATEKTFDNSLPGG